MTAPSSRVAGIVGASPGIGRAIALAARGYGVVETWMPMFRGGGNGLEDLSGFVAHPQSDGTHQITGQRIEIHDGKPPVSDDRGGNP